ncbi:MAG: flagellar basal body L-ring protein FlgH [Thermodesulfobacteriota bacterium]
MRLLVFAGVLTLFLSGCASPGGPAVSGPPLPERLALPEPPPETPPRQEGTIYSARTGVDLYRDSRASRVGDILLVKIVETSTAQKKAETKTERSSTVTGQLTSLFGFEQALEDKNPRFSAATALSAGLTNDFDGKGETTRDSKVTATISARVVETTMEGNLVIRGYREIQVNNETQFLILTGVVRPADIGVDNSIPSTHVADARIEYTGRGVVGDKQRPGWLARTLDVIWPF